MNQASHILGINRFSDLNHSEYVQKIGKNQQSTKRQLGENIKYQKHHEFKKELMSSMYGSGLPMYYNWNDRKAVSPVHDNLNCEHAHWAFAVADVIASTAFIQNNGAFGQVELETLSAQQLIDCMPDQGKWPGCTYNADFNQAFEYVKQNGLYSEEDYPFTGTKNDCKDIDSKKVVMINSYTLVSISDPSSMIEAVFRNPIVAEIDPSSQLMQMYKSDVINSQECGQDAWHKVLIVGWGINEKNEYWIVKNSWGTDWGEQGYAKIAMVDGPGICGIQLSPYSVDIGPFKNKL
ncbi:cysteine protease [Stylonychia lemnae]|uniref:Cysteine protease n=1 Tax=Stylonychia lemnae TaxID=5949 RepID=A0A078B5R6_STYLE|nr:cysteine protease [Stylonychia lemnae]|eukprot:CDW89551.1 cysteine protease [Stylonychia lemnae]